MISYAQNLVEYFRHSRQFYYLILDLQGNCSYVNPLFQETCSELNNGFTTGLTILSISDRNKLLATAKKCLENPSLIIPLETTLKSADGNCFLIQWEISAIIDREGKPENIHAIGVDKNTTNGGQSENIVQKNKEGFRHVVSNLKFGVVIRDSNGKALLCNKTALNLTGLSEEEFLKTTLPIKNVGFVKEDGIALPHHQHPTNIAAQTKTPVRDVVLGVYKKKRKDCRWMLVNAEPIVNNKGELLHVITTFVDITERKKLEQKLIGGEINKQKIITRATIEGQEKERKEIGRELHDNINQILTTTQLYLEIAKGTADVKTLEMIQLSSKSIAHVIEEIRKLSRSLTPPALGDLGLVESVKDLCESIKTTQVFTIRFYHKNFDESILHENVKLMLFRIVQEQINNIIRYANATTILIRFITDRDQVMLVISDNGKGFDPLTTKKGLGLNNIINRAELFNGKVEIKSGPEQGCSIIVIVPI
ncbi:MAG TPA: PAS domain S-box protein [Chitinophagaceae bacterium]|jgi:PAS domain S-box-containing protein|nr:PAS domain S-box protein [Chitinophagaceae bacterium]